MVIQRTPRPPPPRRGPEGAGIPDAAAVTAGERALRSAAVWRSSVDGRENKIAGLRGPLSKKGVQSDGL